MDKSWKVIAGVTVAAGLLAGCGSTVSGKSSQTINVGMSVPMTGQFAEDGSYMKQGLDLALKQINNNGGIDGKKIKVFYEDDQGPNPTAATNAVNKMIQQDHVVAVVGPQYTPAMLACLPIFAKNHVPTLTGATGPADTRKGSKWIFRIGLDGSVADKLLVQYAVKDLHLKRIGVDYVNTSFGQSNYQAIKNSLEKDGVTPVKVQTHLDTTKDFTSQILSFKKKHVDGVIMSTDDQPGGLFMSQMHQLGAHFKVLGGETFSLPTFLHLAGSAANGAYSITSFISNNPSSRVQKWEKAFSKAYNRQPNSIAATYYDAMMVLAQAMKNAKTIDGSSIQKALMNIKGYKGVITTYAYHSGGDMAGGGLVTQVKNQKPVIVKKISQ